MQILQGAVSQDLPSELGHNDPPLDSIPFEHKIDQMTSLSKENKLSRMAASMTIIIAAAYCRASGTIVPWDFHESMASGVAILFSCSFLYFLTVFSLRCCKRNTNNVQSHDPAVESKVDYLETEWETQYLSLIQDHSVVPFEQACQSHFHFTKPSRGSSIMRIDSCQSATR